jgi:esterase
MSTSLLNYQIYNERDDQNSNHPPIIFLHGMLGDAKNWKSQAKRFSEDYQVITVDLRNHGDSPHLKGMSYRQMADDVLTLLDHLGLSSVVLSGHSMGGKVAMYLALNNLERVAKLVVVDIAPVNYPLWHQSLLRALLTLPVETISRRQQADEYLAESIPDLFERAFLLKNLVRVNQPDNQQLYKWKCNLDEIVRNYLNISRFPKLECQFEGEVLFVKGGNSDYITDEYKSEIASYFPHATIRSIANAGHLPHVQQADRFYQLMNDFIA